MNGKQPIPKLVLGHAVRTCPQKARTEPSVPGQVEIPMPLGTRPTLRAIVAQRSEQKFSVLTIVSDNPWQT